MIYNKKMKNPGNQKIIQFTEINEETGNREVTFSTHIMEETYRYRITIVPGLNEDHEDVLVEEARKNISKLIEKGWWRPVNEDEVLDHSQCVYCGYLAR